MVQEFPNRFRRLDKQIYYSLFTYVTQVDGNYIDADFAIMLCFSEYSALDMK